MTDRRYTDDEQYARLRPGPEREHWLWHEMDPYAELTVTDQWTEIVAAYRRSEGKCGICGQAVDLSVTIGPQQPTIDHIAPKSIDWDDRRSNLQLAHRGCNSRKGRKP